MSTGHSRISRWLPFRIDPPQSRPRLVRAGRIGAWALLAAALLIPVVQFQHGTLKNDRKSRAYRQRLAAAEAAGALQAAMPQAAPLPGPVALSPAQRAELARKAIGAPPKPHKGAIGRWRKAVRALWAGQNIYMAPDDPDLAAHLEQLDSDDDEGTHVIYLHPNMPFTVILMTPFAYMPIGAMALSWSLLKVLAIVAAIAMAAELAAHGRRKIPDWVLGLGLAWSVLFIVGDLQHGNTNGFVLLAVVAHLWLYRRGHDWAAGWPLALAICLKMTPALFVLYWLYQRNWKLLGGTLLAGVVLAGVVPAALLGPARHLELTQAWLDNLIVPGLIKGAWYPIHINQSLPGVFSRYFIGEPHAGGNILWNPDDNLYRSQTTFDWITLVALDPAHVKLLIKLAQVAIVAVMAWAIGWRKLPRDDGRRALHYGLVAAGMMLLNQRTWDHHAGLMLLASMAAWQAIAHGRLSRRRRIAALTLVLLAGLAVWLTGTGPVELAGKLTGMSGDEAEYLADVVDAYGPAFYHFLLMLIALAVLAAGLRRREDPYAEQRQTLSGRRDAAPAPAEAPA